MVHAMNRDGGISNMNVSENTTNESPEFLFVYEPQPIISAEVREMAETIFNVLIFVFGCLGVVTNAINIRVFIQQGATSDSSSLSLLFLAISDFCCCFFMVPGTFCQPLKYTSSFATFLNCKSVTGRGFELPHSAMSKITLWLTVYISVERCLCILVPFKVKALLTPRVAVIIVIFICIMVIGCYVPFFMYTIEWRFYVNLNASVITFVRSDLITVVCTYLISVIGTFWNTSSIIIVSLATGLMLHKLTKYKKWREKTASTGKSDVAKGANSDSDKQAQSVQGKKDIDLLKMVVVMTILFLVCVSMAFLPTLTSAFIPGYSFSGLNKDLFSLALTYSYFLSIVNSSLNFFFYVKISTRYREAYNEVFGTGNKG